MEYTFHFQDPTDPDTMYLIESIIDGFDNASSWRGIYAFASQEAIDTLFQEESVTSFLSTYHASLIIGIDAITNRATLELCQEYQTNFPNLTVNIFWNPVNGLFHPKISHFTYREGDSVIAGVVI